MSSETTTDPNVKKGALQQWLGSRGDSVHRPPTPLQSRHRIMGSMEQTQLRLLICTACASWLCELAMESSITCRMPSSVDLAATPNGCLVNGCFGTS